MVKGDGRACMARRFIAKQRQQIELINKKKELKIQTPIAGSTFLQYIAKK
jgi:hypothetical protein